MTKQEIQTYFDFIRISLKQKQVKQAFDLLAPVLSSLKNWQLQEQTTALEDTYKTMLHYAMNGVQDTAREKVHTGVIRSLLELSDTALLQLKTGHYDNLFYERRRAIRFLVSETFDQLLKGLDDVANQTALLNVLEGETLNKQRAELEVQKSLLIRKLFYLVWLGDEWTTEEDTRWKTLFNTSTDDEILQVLIVTGLTLSLLETFDAKRAGLLFEAAQNENAEISERALTGIVLFIRKYDDRMYLYPELTEQLKLLADNSEQVRKICHVLLQFILSRETEKITQHITTELIPEMMQKMKPKKGKSPIIFLGNPELGDDDQNPEWKKFMESSELQEKLQEISELQMEGADVMHSSFIHLKQYPFFNEPSNWFVPFSLQSDAIENAELAQLAELLTASTTLCNSDKYSFFWSILQMPDDHRKHMISQFSAENKEAKEMMEEELPAKKIDFRTRQYIQDLYRFYKLHPRRADFEDIFEAKPEFYQVPAITEILQKHNKLQLIGEFYFSKNYWKEANDIFDRLLQNGVATDLAVLYQKKGYSLQMLGQLPEALETYLLADVYDTDNPWTVKKIAHLYRQMKQLPEALSFYQKAGQLQPDNLSVELIIGHCYLDLKDYEAALKQYFKVEYLSDNKLKVRRAIAWTSFLMGKYEQATDFYNKILAETSDTAEDYLNAGHVQLVTGNRTGAINLYQLALAAEKRTPKEFADLFANDSSYLIEKGISEEDIPLILDSVLYHD